MTQNSRAVKGLSPGQFRHFIEFSEPNLLIEAIKCGTWASYTARTTAVLPTYLTLVTLGATGPIESR